MGLKGKMKKNQRWKLLLNSGENEKDNEDQKGEEEEDEKKIEYVLNVTVHSNDFSHEDIVFNPDNFPTFKVKNILLLQINDKKEGKLNMAGKHFCENSIIMNSFKIFLKPIWIC
jgi:hypothetical protein